jgi:hypothetical protein
VRERAERTVAKPPEAGGVERRRPLKCVGGPLDGARRHVAPGAEEHAEVVGTGRVALYRGEWRRRGRGPRFAVLAYVGVRPSHQA